MKWIKLWTMENNLPCFEYGAWCHLLRLAGLPENPAGYGKIGVSPNLGYTDEQMAEMIHSTINQWIKIKEFFTQTDKRISVDKKGVIEILNWKHYQSDYVRVVEFRKRFRKETPKETENETPNDTHKNKELRIKNKEEERKDNPSGGQATGDEVFNKDSQIRILETFYACKGWEAGKKGKDIDFKRWVRPAKNLFLKAGSIEKAVEVIKYISDWAKKKDLDFTLETCLKRFDNYRFGDNKEITVFCKKCGGFKKEGEIHYDYCEKCRKTEEAK